MTLRLAINQILMIISLIKYSYHHIIIMNLIPHKIFTICLFIQYFAHVLCSNAIQYKFFIFSEECFHTFFVQHQWLDFQCLKRTLVKALGYAVIVGASIVKFPQIIKIIKKKSTEGVSFPSVVFEQFTQITAVGYNIARGNPFSVYGQTLLISIQMIIIHILFLAFGNKDKKGLTFVALLPVLFVFWTALNPQYFPKYVIQNAMIVQIILFSGARLLQIIQIHKLKATGSLSIITVGLSVLGNCARLSTALVEVADDLIFGLSVINALALNGYILLTFFIFKETKQDKITQKKDK